MSLQKTHFLDSERGRRNPFVTRPRYWKSPVSGAFRFQRGTAASAASRTGRWDYESGDGRANAYADNRRGSDLTGLPARDGRSARTKTR